MSFRIVFMCATLFIASLSGCIGNDDDSSVDELVEPCRTKNLDQDLIGSWAQHTFEDLDPKRVNVHMDGTKTGHLNSLAVSGYCWTIENSMLVEGVHYPQWESNHFMFSNYHIDGDLLFLGMIYSEWIDDSGVVVDTDYDDRPTECDVYFTEGAFADEQTLHAAINSTAKPEFCTWIWADPSGASPTDAWNATYLALDHSDMVSTSTNDNLMTIELDDFYGEIDWYVSEGYFGFWVELTIAGQTHQCDTYSSSDCMITFSGVDEYYAVWEDGEIATLSENGVDICSVTCDIEITRFGVREEDTLAGTETITIQ